MSCPLVLPFKSAFSWFFSGVLFGKEKKKLYQQNCDVFKQENTIGAVKVNSSWYLLDILWCSDLGSQVKQIANFSFNACLCPWCWAHNTYKKVLDCLWPTRITESCMGMNNENIYFCPHHGFARIIAQMITWVSRGEKEVKEKLLTIFARHWQLKNIQFKPREQTEKDAPATDPQTANKFETVSMLTGNVFTYLLKNFGIMEEVFVAKTQISILWQCLLDLWILIHSPFEMISEDFLKTVQGICNTFVSKLNIFHLDAGIPAYIHIITQHLMKMMYKLWKKGLRMSDIDQSSFELSNLVQEHVDSECVCQQANLKPISAKYAAKLEKNQMFNVQKFLNLEEALKTPAGKALYCKLFKCLQIFLHFARRLILCAFYGLDICQMPDMDRKNHSNSKALADSVAKRQEVIEVLERNKNKRIDDETYQAIINQEPEEDPEPVYAAFHEILEKRDTEIDLVELPDNIRRFLVSDDSNEMEEEHNEMEEEDNEMEEEHNEMHEEGNDIFQNFEMEPNHIGQNSEENAENQNVIQSHSQQSPPQNDQDNSAPISSPLNNSVFESNFDVSFSSEPQHNANDFFNNEDSYIPNSEIEETEDSDEDDIFCQDNAENEDENEDENEKCINGQNDDSLFNSFQSQQFTLFDDNVPNSRKRKQSSKLDFCPKKKKQKLNETLKEMSKTHTLTQQSFGSDNHEVVDEAKQMNYSNFNASNLFSKMPWMAKQT